MIYYLLSFFIGVVVGVLLVALVSINLRRDSDV
jgi:tetrahydromethanopterin S-methyltransferase subunit B